jgi:endonuclease YncB( thermonuclease family)
MAFFLIKGTFHVKGYSPDGDSIRFRARNPDNWKKLSGPAAELNARGHAQLRVEGVDALETHYQGYHQPMKLARAACRYLLSYLGIDEVVWDESQSRVIKAQDETEGYILARSTEANRRPVAFVFAGGIEHRDGSEVILDESILKRSLNYGLIARGLAYPTYYNGLFSDLRLPLTRAMASARSEGRGIWPCDLTTKGFFVPSLEPLTENVVILPKLFRRLVDYMGDGGMMYGFRAHLQARCEPLVRVSQVHFTRLDAVVDVKGDRVRLIESPENLIFLDKVLCKKN